MDAEKKRALVEAGVNVDGALDRFMGNEALLCRFLKKFLDDANFENLKTAIEQGDEQAALAASHTLKGVCGNLSMPALFELFTAQVAAYRAGDARAAAEMMDKIRPAYDAVCAAIREL